MQLTERVIEGLRAFMRIHDRVDGLSREVDALGDIVRGLDRRLIRVETAVELATRGAFRPSLMEDKTDPPPDRA